MRKINKKPNKSGAALLMVLLIVMAITILSLGFLSQSNVELACGENMILRAQMDYLAESALEHARGLILNPQDVSSDYWTGATEQQLVAGSDYYYDISVAKSGECNYEITCEAYRENGGERTSQSNLQAELRLDPCIAVWVGSTWTTEPKTLVNGDVYCVGDLGGVGDINGDVFAVGDITAVEIEGKANKYVAQPPVAWPGLDIGDFSSNYYIGSVQYQVVSIDPGTYSDDFWLPSAGNPAGIYYCIGDLTLDGDIVIAGTLVVSGTLTINNMVNVITARKNFPALIVDSKLIFNDASGLIVNGLAQIKDKIEGSGASGASNVRLTVVGALFIKNNNIDGLGSATNSIKFTASADRAAIEIWPSPGNPLRWSPAAGAFFRNIER